MIIIETPDAKKKQALTKADIAAIVAYAGNPNDALTAFNITKEQFDYCKDHYDERGNLKYRTNMDVISYE